MTPTPRVVIVGGGATGLSAAFALTRAAAVARNPVHVTLLEAGSAGGHAQTVDEDGYLVESGPNGFLNREPATLDLVRALGLESRLVAAHPDAKRRFIVRGGRLCRAPESPHTLLATRALSLAGKLRLLGEPFARRPRPGVDETVFDFASRRIGAEAAEMLVDAAVSGISAGDSRLLSVAAQFPTMVAMEREHGSLVRAMFARRKRRAAPSTLMTFDRGMTTLVEALTDQIGDVVRPGVRVTNIERRESVWRVHTDRGDVHEADAVVLAVPARAASRIVSRLDASMASTLGAIPFSGIHVVGLAYRESDVPRPLDGYGYLVTRQEQLATLGVVWESSLCPGRAPEGMVLLRVFLGGARRPELASVGAPAAIAAARADLDRVMHITAPPARTWTFAWPDAIAQYTVGHLDRIAAIRRGIERHPGLSVCGTSYDGTSFNHAIVAGTRTGRDLADQLAAGAWPAARASSGEPALASR
jgi:oxygen-dependent protoporphyrinogen oxidase